MTIEEQDAEIGRAYRALREAEAERDCLELKLRRFHEQIRTVAAGWKGLVIIDDKLVNVIGSKHCPLPTEAEIVNTKLELDRCLHTIQTLEATLSSK